MDLDLAFSQKKRGKWILQKPEAAAAVWCLWSSSAVYSSCLSVFHFCCEQFICFCWGS